MRADKEPNLDDAIDAVRNEPIDPEAVKGAGERVRARIFKEMAGQAPEAIQGCEGFRALFAAYREATLPEARNLLVRDHLHECVGCRRAFIDQGKPSPVPIRRVPRFQVPKWAVAAAITVAAALGSWQAWNVFGPPPSGPAATIASVDGALYRIGDDATEPIAVGEEVSAGEIIRSARNTRAMLRLRDGSVVEVRERSGLSIAESRRDVTIRLNRGSVIVEAAHRTSGHLYVSTRDCRVAVTGTVFNVNAGMKGSRVSVAQGEVHVAQGSREEVLGPGDQYSSSPYMTRVPVAQEFAWSQNAEKHIALLQELSALGKEMDRQVRMPEARYSSRLPGYLPASTAVYVALPNLGETMADAWRVFENQLAQSPALRELWEAHSAKHGDRKFGDVVDELRRFSAYVGDEVVIAAAMDADGKAGAPVFLAELRQSGLAEFAQAELQARGGSLTVFHSAADIAGGGGDKQLLMYITDSMVAVSPNAEPLRQVALAIEGAGGGFASTAFHSQITEAYAEGAGLLVGVDLAQLKAGEKDAEILGNVRYLVIGQKQVDGVPDTRALVSFSGERTGIASWLAPPAPIGALDFVSPSATIVTAAAIKEPTQVLDDLLTNVPDFASEVAEAESKLGLNVRNDLARALGAEFAFAVDGPVFPVPSWKLIAEVYDEATLQHSIARLVEAVNQEVTARGKPAPELSEQFVGGRTYYLIAMPGRSLAEIHYTFFDGYLVMAASRALVDQAIATRQSGAGLVTSAEFTKLLPLDGHNNFSAMFYHHIGPTVGPLADLLTDEQRQAVAGLDDLMEPTLVLAHADRDHILAASRSKAFGFTPGNLFGLRLPMSLHTIFGGRHHPPEEGAAE